MEQQLKWGVPSFFLGVLVIYAYLKLMRRTELMQRAARVHHDDEEEGLNVIVDQGGVEEEMVEVVEEFKEVDSLNFKHTQLAFWSNNFGVGNKIAAGGYGEVYKGEVEEGVVVAIKLCKNLRAADKKKEKECRRSFDAEVGMIGFERHENLVDVLGFVRGEETGFIVYEFVENGTLDHHLHASPTDSPSWTERYLIAKDVGRGLAFMHGFRVIHGDIKSANILLDGNLTAKISDFGTLRRLPDGQDYVETPGRGTFGYMDYNYQNNGVLMISADVYSYGVLLLELLTGKEVIAKIDGEPLLPEAKVLAQEILLDDDGFEKLVDPRLEGKYNVGEVRSMISCAVSCIRLKESLRPTMVEVLEKLERVDVFDINLTVTPSSSEDNGPQSAFAELLAAARRGQSADSEIEEDGAQSAYAEVLAAAGREHSADSEIEEVGGG